MQPTGLAQEGVPGGTYSQPRAWHTPGVPPLAEHAAPVSPTQTYHSVLSSNFCLLVALGSIFLAADMAARSSLKDS